MTEIPFLGAALELPFTLQEAVYTPRFTALARADVRLAELATWDRRLPRDKRILVPVDVQALVVPTSGAEPVAVVGGVATDRAPFDPGETLAAGVHLHWAMPDALLRATHDAATRKPVLPPLPDRWVVVRLLLPEESRVAHVRGWVVDAREATVHDLDGYVAPAPDPNAARLDATSGGSLLWPATYRGSLGRFTLHDRLDDLEELRKTLAPKGFHRSQAVYVVAGWWSDETLDPLARCTGPTSLDRTLERLDWYVSPDGEDALGATPDEHEERLRNQVGMTSPKAAPTNVVTRYSKASVRYSDVAPSVKSPVNRVAATLIGPAATRYHSLLHGCVLGVPVDGTSNGYDERPESETLSGSMGLDVDDVAAALARPGLALDADPSLTDAQRSDRRRTAERLFAAFTGDRLRDLGSPDGMADLEQHEHADTFWSFAGPPLPDARPDVLRTEDTTAFGPTAVGRKGRGAGAARPLVGEVSTTRLEWNRGLKGLRKASAAEAGARTAYTETVTGVVARHQGEAFTAKRTAGTAQLPESRTVTRPAPRLFRPGPVLLGLRGVRPNNRLHGDGAHEDGGVLRCRYPGEAVSAIDGVVEGATVVPTLGSGALPAEALLVAREALLLDGYAHEWLARAGATSGVDLGALRTRVRGEMVRLHGRDGTYDGSGVTVLSGRAATRAPTEAWGWADVRATKASVVADLAAEVARFSSLRGSPPSPVALTNWRQPWVPVFLEWRVRVTGTASLDGWTLEGLDLEGAPASAAPTVDRELVGRSTITSGVGKAVTAGIDRLLASERARAKGDPGVLDPQQEADLAELAQLLAPLDAVSVSLDGVREQLLGIDFVGHIDRAGAGTGDPSGPRLLPVTGPPTPLFGGTLTLLELRLVDAFGRTQTVPVEGFATTLGLEAPEQPATVRLRPRVLHGARWLLRLVDPGLALDADVTTAAEAYVDQVHADVAVSPVSGFLLPGHIDEALEVFDRDGHPLGQVVHEGTTDAVTWEPAPGRPVPPDAGPLDAIPAHAQHAALVATGLVRADIAARAARSGDAADAGPEPESSLTVFLRAVDTTLWSVDTYAAIGTPSIAGLVGRPIAVVRATLRLETPDDLDEVALASGTERDVRRAAFAALADHRFPVRVGDLHRSDDAVLGFFVGDDYSRLRVVDKVVAAQAVESGRHRGHLGVLGQVAAPGTAPLDSDYLEAEDTLWLRPGETVALTLLMLPAGKVHLTSGVLPQKAIQLADEWVTPGLRTMKPSMRVGPVLVDPAEIRLPKVHSFGDAQRFTRRTGPLTWRDDPILASTTAAYLPRMPHEVQEGWIRIGEGDEEKKP